ncbi:hypothetical protein VHEMI02555 [[Torrubiella] hemipterigena]|uniref:CST complex subunit Ten1 n=1 Tax=[Torrubiella] hemipterigena TaxID=1531966 RepID=A0A0A1T8I2_9HYPO|nr:hypothetical protein VHEMI02555 [[Torrubiella] hemipterigena]
MSRGPPPSQLCLLSSIPDQPAGLKVRFLGCVTGYATETGILSLGHLYPAGTDVTVAVDVQLVLHRLSSDDIQVGQWLNVIGTVERKNKKSKSPARVQALLVWSTNGRFDLEEYEALVSSQTTRVP